MNSMPRLLKVFLIPLAIPAFGFAVSFFIIHDINRNLGQEMPSVIVVCEAMRSGVLGPGATAELQGACRNVANIVLLGRASLVAALIGVLVPLLYFFTSVLAGQNRKRIASLFPLVLRLSVFLVAITVLLQGAILTYAAYIGESYAIGRVHVVLIGAIAIGALLGGVKLIDAAMTFGRKLEVSAIGKVLREHEAPRLFSFVHSLAEKLDARPPQNIIVGLEPTFYVTNADIFVPGDDAPVKGETLYISTSLSRLLSDLEFASVIGHELGHFRGEDTVYSMRFAPVYAGLRKALEAVATDNEEGVDALATIPAVELLSYMYDVFSTNVAKISRDREHKADQAGAEVGSSLALASALVKVSLYSGLWNRISKKNIERLNRGKIARNLSIVFHDSAKYDVADENIENILQETLGNSISHPTDSHPPIATRLEAMGINPTQITKLMVLPPEKAAIHLLDNCEDIEKEITLLEHKLMVAYGFVKPLEETERNHLLHAVYSLAAAMIRADGRVDIQEILQAEAIGHELFEEFDSIEFREYCNDSDLIADVTRLSEAMAEMLQHAHKNLILQYLRAIAEADGCVSSEEEALLEKITSGLGVHSYP